MNIGAFLAGIALLVVVAAYVARPLFEGSSSQGQTRGGDVDSRAQLTARRDAIYALIRELDGDYQTGKINDEDYRAQRKHYVAEGVAMLQQLDALSSRDSRVALETEIEAQVLALRQVEPAPVGMNHGPASRFCTQCGHPADPEDRYCGNCGTALSGTAS